MPALKVTDEQLFPALARVFRDYGYEGATLSRISEATGLEKASLYHRFPGGKDQMAEAVLAHVGELFASHIFAPLREDSPIESRIRKTARRLNEFYEEGQRSCLLDTLSISGGGPKLHRQIHTLYGSWQEAFAAAARAAGLSAAAAAQAAQLAITRIHGALVLARSLGDTAPFREVLTQLPLLLTQGQRAPKSERTRLRLSRASPPPLHRRPD
jgi:AcrR family transcriptional regulator